MDEVQEQIRASLARELVRRFNSLEIKEFLEVQKKTKSEEFYNDLRKRTRHEWKRKQQANFSEVEANE